MGIANILEGHELFHLLSVEEVNQISERSTVKEYRADEPIFQHDDAGAHVYLLLEGAVDIRLPAPSSDVSIVVSKVHKGELFGLSPLLGSALYTATAVAAAPTTVLAMETKPLRDLLQSNARTGFHLMSQVANVYFNRYIEVLKQVQAAVNQLPLIR